MHDLPSQALLQQANARPVSGEELEVFGKHAADRYLSGSSNVLGDAVVETVKHAGLSPEQVKRVVEFANTAAYLQEFKKTGSGHRYVEFHGGPADPGEVLKDLNDGGGGTVFDRGMADYSSPPDGTKFAEAMSSRLGQFKAVAVEMDKIAADEKEKKKKRSPVATGAMIGAGAGAGLGGARGFAQGSAAKSFGNAVMNAGQEFGRQADGTVDPVMDALTSGTRRQLKHAPIKGAIGGALGTGIVGAGVGALGGLGYKALSGKEEPQEEVKTAGVVVYEDQRAKEREMEARKEQRIINTLGGAAVGGVGGSAIGGGLGALTKGGPKSSAALLGAGAALGALGGGTLGYRLSEKPEPVKTAADHREEAFWATFKGADEPLPYADPWRDVEVMREKLATTRDNFNSELGFLEGEFDGITAQLYGHVKEAAMAGVPLGQVVRALAEVTPGDGFVKAAFSFIGPRLVEEGVMNYESLGDSLTKTANISGPVNTAHPLVGTYAGFCSHLQKMAEVRAQRDELAAEFNRIDGFVKKAYSLGGVAQKAGGLAGFAQSGGVRGAIGRASNAIGGVAQKAGELALGQGTAANMVGTAGRAALPAAGVAGGALMANEAYDNVKYRPSFQTGKNMLMSRIPYTHANQVREYQLQNAAM